MRTANVIYKERRDLAKTKLGNVCSVCGTTEDLEFDHIDPTIKEHDVSEVWMYEDKFWNEISKCQLLCKPCHIIKTNKEKKQRVIIHGTINQYQRYKCRCIDCKRCQSIWRKKYLLKTGKSKRSYNSKLSGPVGEQADPEDLKSSG